MQRFSALDDQGLLVRMLCLTAELYAVQGTLERAENLFAHALGLAEKQDDLLSRACCQIGLAHTQYIAGDLDSAMDTLQRALKLPQVAYDEHTLIEGLEHLVQVLVHRGRWGQAIQLSKQKIDSLLSGMPKNAGSRSVTPGSAAPRDADLLVIAYAYRMLGLVLVRVGA